MQLTHRAFRHSNREVMVGSDARSNKEGAGPDRPNRATENHGQTSSRKEAERQSGRTKEQIAADKREGQVERENAGKKR